NPSYFKKAKDLRPSLYDEKVIGLGYTPMFLIHSDEALEIENFKRARENKIEFAYDYGNLNASYVNEKINFLDDYFQGIINPVFEKIDSPFQQTSSLKPYVLTVILEKIIIDLEDEVVSLLEKEKENLKTINSLKSKGLESSENAIYESNNQSENDFHVVEKECDQVENSKVIAPGLFKLNLDTFGSVRRPKQSNVIWKKKGSSNTSNVDLSSVSHSKLSKDHMTGNRALLTNFVEKFLGTVRFGNNDFAVIAGYGDVVIGSMTIKNVYYLWHQRLSHFNFATVNNLVRKNFVQGLPKMKFEKDHLCNACEQGKIHQKHHKSKTAFASNKPLYLLHMDLCGPMRIESLNGKRYVLVVVDDYSRYTWNKTLAKFFDEVGITQKFSAARTPQQNGVVERRNRTLVEAARTLLTFTNLPLFLWAESIATARFTQNHSIIQKHFDKTPYELMNKRKPNIKFFRVFGCRCYLLNDNEDVGRHKAKGDIRVFVGYSKEFAAFRIYNKQTHKIHESVNVNVNFDKISEMASKQFSLEPDLSKLNEMGKSSNPSVSQIMKSSTMNVKTSNVKVPSNEEEVFHESSESFQEESVSSSLNDDVQQSSKEVRVPSSNTQSISNNMIPNVD
nr:retrovirus-related Pol polyprotein from transposon TNT 1-94 [Tanacetum cinerariifolium]